MNSAIILAGGIGERIDSDVPKQFIKVNSKKIIDYSIETFSKNKHINEIILVLNKNWIPNFKNQYKKYRLVEGGKTRHESSLNGVLACSKESENIFIHDSARPLISQKIINDCVSYLSNYQVATPIIDIDDSVIRKKNDSFEYLNRNLIKSIQTPQGFHKNIIIDGLSNAVKIGTDDVSTLQNYNSKFKIKFFKGDKNNFKITNNIDLKIFKSLINEI
tara:strand:+ start:812 stop:1465 length:654 start_codon:yes stop_codon:yes gene_type:complete